MVKIKQLFRLLKLSFSEWQKDNAGRLAAALSYYTIFSLAPILIIAIAVAGVIFGQEAAQGEIVRQLQGTIGTEGAEIIETMIENTRETGSGIWATLISVGVLLFGATGLFNQLQGSLNTIWNVKPKPGRGIKGIIQDRFLSFAMILTIGFLLLVSLIFSAALAAFGNYFSHLVPDMLMGLWQVLDFFLSFGVITVLFALIYKVLPDVKIGWSDVWLGAIVTALLFVLGKTLIGLYLGNSTIGSTYGAAGSLVVLLLWVNFSAQILFFGAEFTQVYANRYGSRIVPTENAIAVGDEHTHPS